MKGRENKLPGNVRLFEMNNFNLILRKSGLRCGGECDHRHAQQATSQ